MNLSSGRISFWDLAIAAAVLALCCIPFALNSKNPIEVALLRQYQANTATTFGTCNNPSALAFDGKNIWVACSANSELQEYNASDGTLIATVASVFTSGLFLDSLMYDGKNIWAAASPAGAVVRIKVGAVNASTINPMTCSSLGSGCASVTGVGSGATGLTFDGSHVWVANGAANNLSEITANATNPSATTVALNTACRQPLFLAFDGTNVWVPCRGSNSVQLVNVATPTVQSIITGITAPTGLTYDGTNMWVSSAGTLYEISPSGSSYIVSSAFAVPGGGGGGATFDGKYLWVTDYANAMVTKLLVGGSITSAGSPAALTVVNRYGAGANPESPYFDGDNVWVANSGGSSVSKF
jgi:hypothetical protein